MGEAKVCDFDTVYTVFSTEVFVLGYGDDQHFHIMLVYNVVECEENELSLR